LWDVTNANQSPETRRVQAIIDEKRHARISSLDLSNIQITSLDGIEFPGSLITLDLSNNQISSLKGVKFPARLESLHLSQNQISSLKGVKLPAELRSLLIDRNKLSHFDGFVFPKYLTSFRVDEGLESVIPRVLKQRAETGALDLKLVKERNQGPTQSEKVKEPSSSVDGINGALFTAYWKTMFPFLNHKNSK
jgi:Leucine-rich repeat (LRR) protein